MLGILVGFLTLTNLFSSTSTLAQDNNVQYLIEYSKSHQLYLNQQWLNLLHYKTQSFTSLIVNQSSYLSDVINEDFFFFQDGRSHPEKEFYSEVEGFFNKDVTVSRPLQCKYPARFEILSKLLAPIMNANFAKDNISCEDFEIFKKRFSAHSISLIFSSAYLNNPASAYGHTFLRISSAMKSLNDYAVDFSAQTSATDRSLWTIAPKGILGLLPAQFNIMPFYYKVIEYNDFESRDLWEYPIQLAPNDINLLVSHLWEIQEAKFNYYYFSSNCSYQILTLFEVLWPNSNLLESSKFYTLPSDTLKLVNTYLNEIKSNTESSFIPSKRSKFKNRWHELSEGEKNQVVHLVKKLKEPSYRIDQLKRYFSELALSDEDKAKIIDTAIDFLEFKYAQEILTGKEEFIPRKLLLQIRSELNSHNNVSKNISTVSKPKNDPLLSRYSRRLGIGLVNMNLLSLDLRFVLNDFLDADSSLLEFAELTMLEPHFTWNTEHFLDARQLHLDQLSIIRIRSSPPIVSIFWPATWRLQWLYEKKFDLECQQQKLESCEIQTIQGGIGLSQSFSFSKSEKLNLSLEMNSELGAGDFFNGQPSHYRLFVGPLVRAEWTQEFLINALYIEYFRRSNWPWKINSQLDPPSHLEFDSLSMGLQSNFNSEYSLRLIAQRDFDHLNKVSEKTEVLFLYYF